MRNVAYQWCASAKLGFNPTSDPPQIVATRNGRAIGRARNAIKTIATVTNVPLRLPDSDVKRYIGWEPRDFMLCCCKPESDVAETFLAHCSLAYSDLAA